MSKSRTNVYHKSTYRTGKNSKFISYTKLSDLIGKAEKDKIELQKVDTGKVGFEIFVIVFFILMILC